MKYEDKRFFEERFFYADTTVFEVFSFRLVRGDPKTALTARYSVVLTESLAKKYFGDDDPIGQSIILDNQHNFNVTAVIKDVPRNSHFRFDFLASFETLASLHGERYLKHPGYLDFYTYLLLQENTDPYELEMKFQESIKRSYGAKIASMRSFRLQPLKSIHLHSKLEYEIEANSSVSYIYIYSAIAFIAVS